MDEKRVAEYFIVAGLLENPVPLAEFSCDGAPLKSCHSLPPITDIAIVDRSCGEIIPEGYKCLEHTVGGNVANLNSGVLRSHEMFLCYKRGRDQPPLVDIGVLIEGRDRLLPDSQVVEFTVLGNNAANVNANGNAAYITYRRASEESACSQLVVSDICIMFKNKGETTPHSFHMIERNLNKGTLIGAEIYLCYRKSVNRTNYLAYNAGILDLYPWESRPSFVVPDNLALFCLPMGATLEAWPPQASHPDPVFSTFVLTVQNTSDKQRSDDHAAYEGVVKLYGAAITFYERYPHDKLTQSQRNDLQMNDHFGRRNLVHTNKCICIISMWPFFDTCERFLKYLYQMTTAVDQKVPIERYIWHMLECVPFPSPRRPRILIKLDALQGITLSQLEDSPISLSGAKLRKLLICLKAEGCIQVLIYALTEQKILMHSLQPDVLTAVAEALTMIIFPFHWQCPYIPLCPLGLSDLLDAPTPFLLGFDSRFFDLYDPPPEVICIDLDNAAASIPTNKTFLTSKILPKKALRILKSSLDNIADLANSVEKEVQTHNAKPILLESIDSDFKIKRKEQELENKIQEIFLTFTATILQGYCHYLLPIATVKPSEDSGMPNLFDSEAFVKSKERIYQRFYENLVSTQMFTKFIEERSFVSDKDASLVFFDDCVERVRDDENVTGLLELEPRGSDMTFFLLPPEPPENVPIDGYAYEGFPRLRRDLFPTSNQTQFCPETPKKSHCNNLIPPSPIPGSPRLASPMARRSKHEIKSAQKIVSKHYLTPISWAKCLLSTSFSIWFMHLPAFSSIHTQKGRVLDLAFFILQRIQKLSLAHHDEVCYRVTMQLCGIYSKPVIAVKTLCEMRNAGMIPNAITYGYYNRALLESKWNPSNLLWNKLRNVVLGISAFKMSGLERARRRGSFSDEVDKLSADSTSQMSLESGTSLESHVNNVGKNVTAGSDGGYCSVSDICDQTVESKVSPLSNTSTGSEVDTDLFEKSESSVLATPITPPESVETPPDSAVHKTSSSDNSSQSVTLAYDTAPSSPGLPYSGTIPGVNVSSTVINKTGFGLNSSRNNTLQSNDIVCDTDKSLLNTDQFLPNTNNARNHNRITTESMRTNISISNTDSAITGESTETAVNSISNTDTPLSVEFNISTQNAEICKNKFAQGDENPNKKELLLKSYQECSELFNHNSLKVFSPISNYATPMTPNVDFDFNTVQNCQKEDKNFTEFKAKFLHNSENSSSSSTTAESNSTNTEKKPVNNLNNCESILNNPENVLNNCEQTENNKSFGMFNENLDPTNENMEKISVISSVTPSSTPKNLSLPRSLHRESLGTATPVSWLLGSTDSLNQRTNSLDFRDSDLFRRQMGSVVKSSTAGLSRGVQLTLLETHPLLINAAGILMTSPLDGSSLDPDRIPKKRANDLAQHLSKTLEKYDQMKEPSMPVPRSRKSSKNLLGDYSTPERNNTNLTNQKNSSSEKDDYLVKKIFQLVYPSEENGSSNPKTPFKPNEDLTAKSYVRTHSTLPDETPRSKPFFKTHSKPNSLEFKMVPDPILEVSPNSELDIMKLDIGDFNTGPSTRLVEIGKGICGENIEILAKETNEGVTKNDLVDGNEVKQHNGNYVNSTINKSFLLEKEEKKCVTETLINDLKVSENVLECGENENEDNERKNVNSDKGSKDCTKVNRDDEKREKVVGSDLNFEGKSEKNVDILFSQTSSREGRLSPLETDLDKHSGSGFFSRNTPERLSSLWKKGLTGADEKLRGAFKKGFGSVSNQNTNKTSTDLANISKNKVSKLSPVSSKPPTGISKPSPGGSLKSFSQHTSPKSKNDYKASQIGSKSPKVKSVPSSPAMSSSERDDIYFDPLGVLSGDVSPDDKLRKNSKEVKEISNSETEVKFSSNLSNLKFVDQESSNEAVVEQQPIIMERTNWNQKKSSEKEVSSELSSPTEQNTQCYSKTVVKTSSAETFPGKPSLAFLKSVPNFNASDQIIYKTPRNTKLTRSNTFNTPTSDVSISTNYSEKSGGALGTADPPFSGAEYKIKSNSLGTKNDVTKLENTESGSDEAMTWEWVSPFKLSGANTLEMASQGFKQASKHIGSLRTQYIDPAVTEFYSPANLRKKEILSGGLSSMRSAVTSLSKRYNTFKEALGTPKGNYKVENDPDVPDIFWYNKNSDKSQNQYDSRKQKKSKFHRSPRSPKSPKSFETEIERTLPPSWNLTQGPFCLCVSITSCTKCNNCKAILFDEEIMSGWKPEDSNLNTLCWHCGRLTVPDLTVNVYDLRHTPKIQEKSHFRNVSQGRGDFCLGIKIDGEKVTSKKENEKLDVSQNSKLGEGLRKSKSTLDTNFRSKSTVGSGEKSTDRKDSSHDTFFKVKSDLGNMSKNLETSKVSPKNKEFKTSNFNQSKQSSNEIFAKLIDQGKKLEPITVQYLSPLVLRKELETVLGHDGDAALTSPAFLEQHPILYWNMLWYFKRLNLPSHLPGLCLFLPKLQDSFIHESWKEPEWRNVYVHCLWDNSAYHKELGSPLYAQWKENYNPSSLIKALTPHRAKIPKDVLESLLTLFHLNHVDRCVELLIQSLKKRPAELKYNHFPIYRDLLFFILTALPRDQINLNSFEQEIRKELDLAVSKHAKIVNPADAPSPIPAVFCRKYFMDLEL